MADKIMLLDGHSLLNRAFYGLPDLTNAEGKHTNAILGFLNIMLRYVEEEKPTHLLVAFDRKEPTFRHIKYKEYKGTRKPMPAELHEQVPLMKEVLKTMEIPIMIFWEQSEKKPRKLDLMWLLYLETGIYYSLRQKK